MAEGTNDHQRAMIHHAVAMVNRALRYDRHVWIGQDASALTGIDKVPDNQILVDFALHRDWYPRPSPNFLTTG